MNRTFSIARYVLTGLVGAFGINFNLKATEPDASSPALPDRTTTTGVAGKGTPQIQFETNFVDFGKTTAVDTLAGVFKFKNVGDGILTVAPPEPSCDCTDSKVKPD